jgi:hypothetical protein
MRETLDVVDVIGLIYVLLVVLAQMKQYIYPMLGFKKYRNAVVTISGIELVQQIRKGQFDTSAERERRDATVALVGRTALGMRSSMEKHS